MRFKRTLSIIGMCAASALVLAGCSGGGGANTTETGGTSADGTKEFKIGVTQIVEHPALDAAVEGFKEGLEKAGIKATYDIQNAQNDQSNAATIANKFASDSSINLVLAVSTPSAQAAVQAITTKPVLFTAVTDPVAAKLVKSDEHPGGNATGTNDMSPIKEQIALIKKIQPDVKTIGVIYSSGEVNSKVQVDLAKQAAKEMGLEVKEATVTNSSEVATAAASLSGVQAIYVPTDNVVVSGVEAVVQFCQQNKIGLYSGDEATVKRGAIATLGIDYKKLGEQTGAMAAKILKGEAKPADMPVESQTEFNLVVNPEQAKKFGVTIPESVLNEAAQQVKTGDE